MFLQYKVILSGSGWVNEGAANCHNLKNMEKSLNVQTLMRVIACTIVVFTSKLERLE